MVIVIKEFTKKDMIAQKLVIGIPDKKSIPGVLSLIKKYHIGGVILYKNNYDSLDELTKLINLLKEANRNYEIPLAISIDQEGGRANRLPLEINNIKSSYRLCNSGLNTVKDAASITADILNKLGINMNFAPVLDIKKQKDNNFIGNRAYSSNIKEIIECGRVYCKELEKKNIIPVLKHFPGHGSVKFDSHFFLPVITKFSNNVADVKPFLALMDEEAPAIMVSHILIRKYTNLKPASLSSNFIQNYIKKKLRYNGLLITDELGMRSVRFFYGKYRSIKNAFIAGNDLICFKYKDGYIERVINELLTIDLDLEESFNKVVSYKKKYKYSDEEINFNINLKELNAKIDEINNRKEN